MGWCVYILRCGDGSLYTGITNDLTRRLEAHREGRGARYTRGRLPVEMVYQEARADRSEASKRELAIKQMPRAGKLTLLNRSGVRQSAPHRSRPECSLPPDR
ncbi:MAG: GIY-YIG nuclease family protein [bacterium]|nr:GIY-YIG nuclease family protein [bacterium]